MSRFDHIDEDTQNQFRLTPTAARLSCRAPHQGMNVMYRSIFMLFAALFVVCGALADTAKANTMEYAFFPRSSANQFDVAGLTATQSGLTAGFAMTVAQGAGDYAVTYTTAMPIGTAGTYEFSIATSDAARLTINGVVVAQTGIPGASNNAQASVNLQTGTYPVVVEYYGSAQTIGLDIGVSGPGLSTRSLQDIVVAPGSDRNVRSGSNGSSASPAPAATSAPAQTASAAPAAPIQAQTFQPVQTSSAPVSSTTSEPELSIEDELALSQQLEPANNNAATVSTAQALNNINPSFGIADSNGDGDVMGQGPSTAYLLAQLNPNFYGDGGASMAQGTEAVGSNTVPGLNFRHFDLTNGPTEGFTPGNVTNFEVAMMSGEGAGRVVFTGYLNITAPGRYMFTTNASGSALMTIDGRVVVNGPGNQAGVAGLGVGLHALSLTYRTNSQPTSALDVIIEGPGLTRGTIPESMLVRDPNGLNPTFSVTVTGGTTGGNVTSLYEAGDAVTILANSPAPTEIFAQWTAANPADLQLLANPTAASASFRMPNRNIAFTATYQPRPANTFALTVVGGSGGGNFAAGTPVPITATPPNAEMQFSNWTVTGAPATILAAANQASTTVTMPSVDVTVTANFVPVTHPVTIVNGSGTGNYPAGTLVTITANPAPAGETFSQWSGDIARAGATFMPFNSPTVVTVPAGGLTLTANYLNANANVQLLFTSPSPAPDITDEKGFTVTGVATAQSGIQSLAINALIGNNPTPLFAQDVPVSVGPTGRWAFRFFDEQIPPLSDVQVIVRGTNGNNETGEARLTVRADDIGRPLEQLINRTTWGVTPEMLTRARQMGFDAFLAEQLAPQTINDSVRQQLNPDGMLLFPDNTGRALDEAAAYLMRYILTTDRQLQEVMAFFWDNHFNTELSDEDIWQAEYEELAGGNPAVTGSLGFRTAALGSFRNLLDVSAKSPAMMIYLNNDQSRRDNINENYARELLELHTVGVNGGYGPADIIEVAEILTGWDADNVDVPGDRSDHVEFDFDPNRHDTGDKTVPFLNNMTFQGVTGEAGIQEGEQLLDILAGLPQTGNFVCGKLIQVFVNDVPPAAVQTACEASFQQSNGNMATVVGTILNSEQFRNGRDNYRAKFKTPLEYYMSLIRNFGIEIDLTPRNDRSDSESLDRIAEALRDAGYGLWQMTLPTGYDEVAGTWANSGSLVERFNFALDAFSGGLNNREITFDPTTLVTDLGLETAEEIATYFMTLSMGDRYSQEEYNAVMAELLGTDGVFDITGDEEDELIRAFSVMAVMPSFQYQ